MEKSVSLKVKYQIGQKLKSAGKVYSVIGYEFIKGRTIRYVLAHLDANGAAKWEYMYDFEIKMLMLDIK